MENHSKTYRRMTTMLEREDYEWMHERAELEDRSVSSLNRQALRAYRDAVEDGQDDRQHGVGANT